MLPALQNDELLAVFDEAMQLDIYREDQMWRDGTHPALQQRQRQRTPEEVPQQPQQQLAQAPGELPL
jgi:hypothetical protein